MTNNQIPSTEQTRVIAEICVLIETASFRYRNEAGLRDHIARSLIAKGYDARTEVRCAGGRIDVTVGRVGIECKIAGSAAALRRQLDRYANGGDFDALVVATTKASHHQVAVQEAFVPVTVALAWGGAL